MRRAPTVGQAIASVFLDPWNTVVRRWNWKASMFSSASRGMIFLVVNLPAGWTAASGAMAAEFLYRAAGAGFYGAFTQALSRARPRWQATLAAFVALPCGSHLIEYFIHEARGTPNIAASIAVSACFTAVTTLFNLYAMRRGVLLAGPDGRPLLEDLRRLPRMITGFVGSGLEEAARLAGPGRGPAR